ncbi:helix-turn-helix domain-containing protein [Bradyrhizobium sp. AUGA SZCCT0222]|uniref:helix-turn-helix domain-containing protein n=1 Tax=Bradyrhizobium sp. AUGA SZCCT0222 TaxID=2807668 RepID=UPI001BA6589B|nr:helix-turn-helix domain-containing protein [Bradyrhizobium sp. AUGA SZCCT0222]MBR1266048.1 helix-turn-helix domain-containing protein [Bradyrhizobium sp. AUGA SZCCT0222]
MQLGSGLEAFAEKPIPALHAERFSASLAPAQWVIRQRGLRRSHLMVIEARRGAVALRGTHVAFEAPALLWLPADLEGDLQVEAGAQGYLIAISEDFLTKTVAGSAEALHLRRTIDRLVLLKAGQVGEAFNAVIHGCDALVRELHSPGRGTATMMSSHVLLLCLHLWRSVISGEAPDEAAHRGDGTRLVGNFLQMVELHYRDGWQVARYAAALGVTEDKLHAHCKREKGVSPRAVVHLRLIEEACTRLQQLDLPVEQIGYGLGFRDPGYFSRFFRKHQGVSPGAYRRRSRLEQMRRGASYAAWP